MHFVMSRIISFPYFGSNSLLGKDSYKTFWKCNEKIELSPLSFLTQLQLYSKLHVVYLQILQ